jgi:anti-anti-sigma factor
MAEGRVTYAQEDRWHVLRYVGRVDYTLAPAIDRFVQGLFADGGVRPFLFDLREARVLDSTNLGLLARIADRVRAADGGRSVIVSSYEDINEVLTSMGFSEIFDILPDLPYKSRGDCEEMVTGEPPSHGELLKTMLDAHRTLVSLNDRDRQRFQDVVTMLEAEIRTR